MHVECTPWLNRPCVQNVMGMAQLSLLSADDMPELTMPVWLFPRAPPPLPAGATSEMHIIVERLP